MPNTSLRGRTLSEKVILFLAFGFGFGWIRPAPGTWGTLPGVFIAYFLLGHWGLHLGVAAIFIVGGIWVCQRASDILGVHDFDGIVIDEIAGVLITLLWFQPTALTLVLGFAWFRLFDIVKPWPIKWADQKVSGGLGIMLDDIIAGVFAWLALFISLQLISFYSRYLVFP